MKWSLALVFLAIGASAYAWLRPCHADMPEVVLFVLPDALWTTAYLFICDAIWATESRNERLAYGLLVPCIGVLSEMAQLVGWLRGTFDPFDLLAYTLPYLIYLLYVNHSNQIQPCNLQTNK